VARVDFVFPLMCGLGRVTVGVGEAGRAGMIEEQGMPGWRWSGCPEPVTPECAGGPLAGTLSGLVSSNRSSRPGDGGGRWDVSADCSPIVRRLDTIVPLPCAAGCGVKGWTRAV